MHQQRSQQDFPSQYYYGNSQGRQENKLRVHSVSSPTLTPTCQSRFEQHVANLGKIIHDQIKASQKDTNNSDVSHTRDNSVEPSIISATIKTQDLQVPTCVASTFVHEEALIIEPKQQVFEDTQLDEDQYNGDFYG